MLKSKHNLIVFKKLLFQFFYFGFVVFFYGTFIKYVSPTSSNFQNSYLVFEMLLICYLGFYLNYAFFSKKLFKTKKYFSFFIKNTISITALLLVWFYTRIVLDLNMPIISPTVLYFNFCLLLFTLTISLFYSDWIYQIENKAAMYRAIKEKNKFEVELLKSQFSPHFLFNTLNSIYSKCHNTSPDAAIMIQNLANFIRYLIYDCSTHRVLINREVTMIYDFIKLYKLNYSDALNITFKHKLFDECQRIAPMLLLNFIENAFKHSQVGVAKGSFVAIELATDQDFLYFKIENNKILFQNKLEKGIGNFNTLSRLDLDYRGQYEYKVTDQEKLYTVNLKIRL